MRNNKILVLISIVMSVITYSNGKDFSFKNYKPNTTLEYNISDNKLKAKINIPVLSGNDIISRRINRTISNFESSNKDATSISYEIITENAQVLSILFKVEKENKIIYTPYNFDMTTGKQFKLSDLFQKGYEEPMKLAISDRIRQIGLPLIEKFNGVNDKTKFIFYPDSIEFLFDNATGTKFGDETAFVPFKINELVGILK